MKANPRPIRTHYSSGKVAHACTPTGALRAAFRRVLEGSEDAAYVYSPRGKVLAGVGRTGMNLIVNLYRLRGFS